MILKVGKNPLLQVGVTHSKLLQFSNVMCGCRTLANGQ